MRLRIALVCLVWGEEFARFFARYCLPSLLEPHNIPLVSQEQDVTLLLYTDQATQGFLERFDSFNALSRFAEVECVPLGDLPSTARSNHWIPWQHAVAGRSHDFDSFLVVIPDCIYAAGCLGTILDALEEYDTVYYRLPQVCKETVAVELDDLRRVDGHEYIGLTSLQAVELFIRHVNPKHAAAACSGTFFVNHPEYAVQLSPESMIVSETASHPLAVRSTTRSVSYTFAALCAEAKTCYLEILGVSAEPAIKFAEQYYRWPKLHRDLSRFMNLGSWAANFRDERIDAYSKSATHIALDHGRVLAQHQGQVKHAKTKFLNATLNVLAVAVQVYLRAQRFPDDTAAKYVALVMAAPGFHRHLRRLQSEFTVVLPRTARRFEEVVEQIENDPAATELLRRFLLLHIVPHPLPILPGHAIFLTYPEAADNLPKAFIVDPHTVAPGAGLWGKALTPPQWVRESAFCVEADIDYTHLTWSLLDPANGAAGRVLDHSTAGDRNGLGPGSSGAGPPDYALHGSDRPSLNGHGASTGRARLRLVTGGTRRIVSTARNVSKFSAVKVHDIAAKLPLIDRSAWLARNLYRRASGRSWLTMGEAGIGSPVSRLARREALALYRIAHKVLHLGYAPRAPSISSRLVPSESARANYDAISRLNIINNLAKIVLAFYERLGLNPQQSPVYACLAKIRSKLMQEVETHGADRVESSLERFELAWRAYDAGEIHEALQMFREVMADDPLVKASTVDPWAREAFVRAADILGRHAELRGDANAAAQLHRRVLRLADNGIVARRLLLMLWREGRLRAAAELAPRIVKSDQNLVEHLRGSETVDYLTRWFEREARREPAREGERNA